MDNNLSFVKTKNTTPNTVSLHENKVLTGRVQPSEHTLLRHLSQAGACFRNLYTNDLLTDVNISIGDLTFSAHKTVLITHSEYLKKALIDTYIEHGHNGHPEIQLEGLPATAFQTVLEFMYTAEMVLTMENIADVHYTSQQLIVKDLFDQCVKKVENITVEEALIILETSFCKESDICRRASEIVVRSFHEIMDSQYLMKQQFSILMTLLTSDELVVDSEMAVFLTAMAWIQYDYDNRFKYVSRVLKTIRFCYMDPMELMVCSEMIEALGTNFRQILLDAMWYSVDTILSDQSDMSLNLPPRRRYRQDSDQYTKSTLPIEQGRLTSFIDVSGVAIIKERKSDFEDSLEDKVIVIVGGMNISEERNLEKTGKSIYAYTPDDQGWKNIGELPEPRHLHGVVIMMDCLYVVGGSRPHDTFEMSPSPTATVNKWDIKTKLWSQCADMNDGRIHHNVTALNNRIYAVGGQTTGGRLLTSLEAYTPVMDRWEQMAPLRIGRIGAAVTTHNGKIISAGGYKDVCTNLSGEPVMNTMEMYCPESDTWTSLADLTIPRCHSSLVEIRGDLYLCGGATPTEKNENGRNESELKSIANVDKYEFDNGKGKWQKFTSLKCSRHGLRAVAIGSKVFIIGGVSTSSGVVNDIECLDMQTGLSRCSSLVCSSKIGMGVAVCYTELLDTNE